MKGKIHEQKTLKIKKWSNLKRQLSYCEKSHSEIKNNTNNFQANTWSIYWNHSEESTFSNIKEVFLIFVLVVMAFAPPIFIIFLLILFKNIYLLCIQYSVCVYVCRPEEGTRPHYRWLWATMWLLEIELRTPGRAENALNCWAVSSDPVFCPSLTFV